MRRAICTTTLTECGFIRSKLDSCLYLCHDPTGTLEGVLGAHVDDTVAGGKGETYDPAVGLLRQISFQKV